ncbi:MAG: hypothetical protein P0Y62_07620 [Candidatus Chryseobacterium colombiense]|nr:hypothetical protein [Chryseobacterium sp.]WEK71422.1 MAG: hypothetical protein P0Y62_07620 [Chryseobacterium sp.]
MKNNTLKLHKRIGLEIQDKNSDNQSFSSEKKIDINVLYRFFGNYSYAGPFMLMIDVTFVFDELKKMVKKWLAVKNKN